MALSDDVISNLRGFSKAMYSTWFHYKPGRLLFDAGEGVSSQMENFIFGIENIFLSHGHYDHIGGLGGIVHSRASARGDKEKPLAIYHPRGCKMIELMKQYVSTISGNVPYELEWRAIDPGEEIEFGAERGRGLMKTFAVTHSPRTKSLGYKIFERRRRLRKELADFAQDEIQRLAREKGSDAITEEYEQAVLAYCGDSAPVNPDDVRGADVLMHEATFIVPDDRAGEGHSTVAEALDVARAADVKHLLLMHISTRYPKRQIEKLIRKIALDKKFDRPLTIVTARFFTDIMGPGGKDLLGETNGRE